MKELIFKNEYDHPINLLTFLRNENKISRKLITKLKQVEMGITCNGKLIRTIDMVAPGDTVVLHIDDCCTLEPNSGLSVERVYEDDQMVIFNKPQGMPVHPSINHYTDTLGNFFAFVYPDCTFRPVNRLDRNTSGLCVVAKNQHSAFVLQHRIKKVYYAVVCGKLSGDGIIDAPIARETESLIKRHVDSGGQRAVTHYRIIGSCDKYTYAEVELETGRTHQIRVHFSYIGHPLAGDDLYGGTCEDINGQALHCGKIFISTDSGDSIEVSAPLNENMLRLIKKNSFC